MRIKNVLQIAQIKIEFDFFQELLTMSGYGNNLSEAEQIKAAEAMVNLIMMEAKAAAESATNLKIESNKSRIVKHVPKQTVPKNQRYLNILEILYNICIYLIYQGYG